MVSIDNNHRIVGARNVPFSTGAALSDPRFIVVHNTAGNSVSGAVSALQGAGTSYNVLIDKDGSYHQLRPFNQRTGHCGRSNWKASGGLENGSTLNATGISISLVNLGGFMNLVGGRWFYDLKNGAGSGPSVAEAEANLASSVYRPARPNHWTPYPAPQIAATRELIAALVDRYPSIEEIVGHEDVAIGRKIDPGPLFPMEEMREAFGKQGGLGLVARVRSPDGELNLRDRPGTDGRVIRVLRNGDTLHVRTVAYTGRLSGLVVPSSGQALSGWASVDVDGSNRHAGFVHMRHLTATPLAAAYAARL